MIRCEVDGVLRQESRTGELVFSPADLVAYASQVVTLRPATSSSPAPRPASATPWPAGVPPAGPGGRTTIEGIGELRNRCRAEA